MSNATAQQDSRIRFSTESLRVLPKIIDLVRLGKTDQQIADEVGMPTDWAVKALRQRAGIKSLRSRDPSTYEFPCCSKCQELKPRTEFGPNRSKKHGVRSWCRACEMRHPALRRNPASKPRVRGVPMRHFWPSVAMGDDDACWPWMSRLDSKGYGFYRRKGLATDLAHRLAYEALCGPISAGLQIDHRCHTDDNTCLGGVTCPHRSCINPAHMEPVTGRENTLRSRIAPTAINAAKTHCIRGHAFGEANTRTDHRGNRQCLACRRERHQPLRSATQ